MGGVELHPAVCGLAHALHHGGEGGGVETHLGDDLVQKAGRFIQDVNAQRTVDTRGDEDDKGPPDSASATVSRSAASDFHPFLRRSSSLSSHAWRIRTIFLPR